MLYRDNGKGNGNYYLGFKVSGMNIPSGTLLRSERKIHNYWCEGFLSGLLFMYGTFQTELPGTFNMTISQNCPSIFPNQDHHSPFAMPFSP